MRPPRLVGCVFGPNERFARMARVLRYSAALHNPGWSIEVTRILVDRVAGAHRMTSESHEANTQKLDYWTRVLESAPDGDRILFMDVDAMVLNPLDPLWEMPFDLAYTGRAYRYEFNSGVMAVRVNDSSRSFFRVWSDVNLQMWRDGALHQHWRQQFGGINQASFGCLLRTTPRGTEDVFKREIPCLEWNCEDSNWGRATPEQTRIVHVKSQLRSAVFRDGRLHNRRADWLVTLWRSLEADAIRAEAHGRPA